MSQNLGIVFLFIDDNSKKLFFFNEAQLQLTQNKSLQRGNASDNSWSRSSWSQANLNLVTYMT